MCVFFNDTATTEIYTLSLHDALPISRAHPQPRRPSASSVGTLLLYPGGATSPYRGSAPISPPARCRLGCSTSRRSLRLRDRKSTRLNSSHANISYAVFCLKKKTNSNH